MKWLLGLIILAVGCGKSPSVTSSGNQLGQVISPVLATADSATVASVRKICDALAVKDSGFRMIYVNGISQFKFNTSFTDCLGAQQNSNVSARVTIVSSQLDYELISGQNFSTQLETPQRGKISALCSKLSSLTQPVQVSTNTLVQYEIVSGSFCSGTGNSECVVLKTAFRQEDDSFVVTMEDKFLIEMQDGALKGMVKRHETTDLANCNDKKQTKYLSIFTGITN